MNSSLAGTTTRQVFKRGRDLRTNVWCRRPTRSRKVPVKLGSQVRIDRKRRRSSKR